MEYKDTLLMPQTTFNMRGNLPENEALMRETWHNLYQQILEKNSAGEVFVLHDGPPYANGDIHIGHALNKLLKDFVNRYKMMMGYKVIYIPGWDVHGLPIETAITKSGVDRKSISKSAFRKLCEDYATEQISNQKQQFQKLNVIGDWDNYYATMEKEFEAKQIEVFATMAQKGLIFKGLKPVYWSPSSESALAEAEIEYHDKQDNSIYVSFKVVVGNEKINENDFLVIWTTTPWTLPGNLAIAVNQNIKYVIVEFDSQRYIVAKSLLEKLAKSFDWQDYQIIDAVLGSQLENIKYEHCFNQKKLPVVLGDHVTLEAGTGLVHTAPGYGADDFEMGQKYDLGMVNGINDQGYLNEESGEFNGLFYEEGNEVIIKKLESLNILLKKEKITHSYPHDWRTKKPVIFRATNQWFCSIEKIKEKLLNEIEHNIKWDPKWGKLRMYNMIKERGDWCISRQRVWGVPIPIFYNEDSSPILDYEVMMHVAELFRQHGSNIWFEKEAKELLPENYQNEKSPNGDFTKEEDIMDVWFDSGSSHTSVLKTRGLPYPADMYLEGSDQYRGWFNSSLITGVAVHNQAPYKAILSHGFVLDAKGLKMSKSLGNVVDPLKIIKQSGADILRLWVASVDYREDVRISEEMIEQVKENYRKLRNTYRFMLGNLFDFEQIEELKYNDLGFADKYILIKLNQLIKQVNKAYQDYNYQDVYRLINSFVTFTLSNFYLDFTKDILYIEKANSKKRRGVQTVIYQTLESLTLMMAVITPFTSEEVYRLMTNKSVHLQLMPKQTKYQDESEIEARFELFFKLKNDIYKALEEARNAKVIGKSLEAEVILNVSEEYKYIINDDFKQMLIVSKVTLSDEPLTQYQNCQVEIKRFDGIRCERCWAYFEKEEMQEDICQRCYKVIN